MVVLAASVLSKASGATLLGRAFVSISRQKLEGYLQSFSKLVTGDSACTFIETDAVRYVYQPMEQLYLVLLTTKASNLLDDLETLRMMAKLVPEYCGQQSEEAVRARCYELSFAVDELVTPGGHRDHATLQQIKTFTEMDSHEEKLQKIIMESKMNQARDEARRKASDIDHQKAQARQAAAMAGANKYSSYGSESGSGGGGSYSSGPSSYERQEVSPAAPVDPSPRKAPSASSSLASKGKIKGMQLSKAKKTDDFFDQLNKEEKLAPPTGRPVGAAAAAGAASASAASPAAAAAKQSVRVLMEEKVVCALDREGGIKRLEIKGKMKLSIFDPDDARIVVRTSGLSEKDGFKCRLHPKINKQLWASEGGLGLGDPSKAFPVGSDNAPIILTWSKSSNSDDDVPLTLNFWPNVEHGRTVVSVEYSAENARVDLQDVRVTIPCPSREAPEVASADGDTTKFDAKNKQLLWHIGSITDANKSGTLEFSVPEMDGDAFFPLQVQFEATSTLSQISIQQVQQADGGAEVAFAADTQVGVESYTVE